MMPQKRVGRSGVPLYLLVAVVLLPGLFSAAVLMVSLRTNERAVESERLARVQSELSRRQSELAFCQLVVLLDDTYKESPPQTLTGKRVAAAMSNLRVANNCP